MPKKPRKKLRFPHDFSLSLALLGTFLLLATLQCLVGHQYLNNELRDHHQPTLTFAQYLTTGLCWESLSENWESEFLEMAAFVWLTSCLVQRGSPESRDPDDPPGINEKPLTKNSPWAARKGGIIAALYAHSLSIALFLLFLMAFTTHALAGTAEYNRTQLLHHESPVSVAQFITTSNFWFQSLQNWQSEFLGIAAMVILAIWLRQKGSPESKPVNAPHWDNE